MKYIHQPLTNPFTRYQYYFISQILNAWSIENLHLGSLGGKCRYIQHTLSVWVCFFSDRQLMPQMISPSPRCPGFSMIWSHLTSSLLAAWSVVTVRKKYGDMQLLRACLTQEWEIVSAEKTWHPSSSIHKSPKSHTESWKWKKQKYAPLRLGRLGWVPWFF